MRLCCHLVGSRSLIPSIIFINRNQICVHNTCTGKCKNYSYYYVNNLAIFFSVRGWDNNIETSSGIKSSTVKWTQTKIRNNTDERVKARYAARNQEHQRIGCVCWIVFSFLVLSWLYQTHTFHFLPPGIPCMTGFFHNPFMWLTLSLWDGKKWLHQKSSAI